MKCNLKGTLCDSKPTMIKLMKVFASEIETFNFTLALLLYNHNKNSDTFIPNLGWKFLNNNTPDEKESELD